MRQSPDTGRSRDVEFDLQARIKERIDAETETLQELAGLEARAEFEKALMEDQYAQVPATLRGAEVKERKVQLKDIRQMLREEDDGIAASIKAGEDFLKETKERIKQGKSRSKQRQIDEKARVEVEELAFQNSIKKAVEGLPEKDQQEILTARFKKKKEINTRINENLSEPETIQSGFKEVFGATGTSRPRGPVEDISRQKEKIITTKNYNKVNNFALDVAERWRAYAAKGQGLVAARKLLKDTKTLLEYTQNTYDSKIARLNKFISMGAKFDNQSLDNVIKAITEELPYNEARIGRQRDLIDFLEGAIKNKGRLDAKRIPAGFQGPGVAIIGKINKTINKYLPNIRNKKPIDVSKEDPEMQEFLGRLEYLETHIPGINTRFGDVAGAMSTIGMPQINIRALFPYMDMNLSPTEFRSLVHNKLDGLKKTGTEITPDNFLSIDQRQLDNYLSSDPGEVRYAPSTSTADAPRGKDTGGDIGAEKMAGIADEIDSVFKTFIKCRKGLIDTTQK